jgi:glycosyltransferase involved in cell wall biosynthesis
VAIHAREAPGGRRMNTTGAGTHTGGPRRTEAGERTTWHLATGEYPPSTGGVAQYAAAVARGLADAQDVVHVWAPGGAGEHVADGVTVHRVAGTWSAADADALTPRLLAAGRPATLLVQWVPHAFGARSLNVAFCRWVGRIARAGVRVHLVVHEPFLAFGGSWRRYGAAAVHRLMLALLLRAASQVYVTVPAWERHVRAWRLGSAAPITWLPVPSNIPLVARAAEARQLRARLLGARAVMVGHFGTYGVATEGPLRAALSALAADPQVGILLIGNGSERFRAEVCRQFPHGSDRLTATGALDDEAVSLHLQACDLMLQPFIDGASSRRTTLMAALAHGKPVVTTVGHLSEALWADEHGRAVLAVPVADADALVRQVLRLARDEPLRHAIGTGARQLYDTRFALPHLVATLRAAASRT